MNWRVSPQNSDGSDRFAHLIIPGISYRMGAMILAEIVDFSLFDSPDSILALLRPR